MRQFRSGLALLVFLPFFVQAETESAQSTAADYRLLSPQLLQHQSNVETQTFCILGDSGASPQQLEVLAAHMLAQGCTQVRVLGDLIYPKGLHDSNDPQQQEKFFQPFHVLFEAGVPFYLIQGNHDFKNDAPNAWLEIAAKHPLIHYPAFYYAETYSSESGASACIINLETTYYDKIYYPVERWRESKWFDATMEKFAADQCAFSLVLSHHPLRSPGAHGDAVPQLAWFLDRSVVGHVDLLISGHEHILADAGVEEGTHMLISGSAAKHGRIENKTDQTHFAAAKPGYISLRFASGDSAKSLKVNARFWALNEQQQFDIVWEETMSGQGIRP